MTVGIVASMVALAPASAVAQTNSTSGRNWWSRSVADPVPQSEPQGREVLLGTITTGKSESGGRQSVADQLLADGLEALHRGDVMLGRRRLEAVIDSYPESLAAMTARDELSVLYNIRARTMQGGTPEPTARWVPTQNAPDGTRAAQGMRDVRAVGPDDRSTFSKEARARESQNRRDERWLRALSFDFQMAAGDRVFFAESSAEIGTRSRAVIAAQARWLIRHPGLPVVIEAHADDYRGSRDFDIRISETRARAVQDRLVQEGIEPSRIRIVAMGHDRPVATCPAPECAAQNRRVITRLGTTPSTDTGQGGVDERSLATVPSPARRD